MKKMTIASPVEKNSGIHKYLITEDVTFQTTILNYEFKNDWLNITKESEITVKGSNPKAKGYAWDGCSPKSDVFNLFLLGIPDGRVNINTGKPFTYNASLIHDALCQFRQCTGIPRKVTDEVFFYTILEISN